MVYCLQASMPVSEPFRISVYQYLNPNNIDPSAIHALFPILRSAADSGIGLTDAVQDFQT